jgi:Outer membrane protein beta-barrel domain
MKKLTFTCSIVLLAYCSIAQGISGGVKVGLNLANQKISGDGISFDTKMKPGVHVGAYVTIMFSEKLGLQPEVLFSTQGTKFDIDGFDVQMNFNYLNVPILVRYNITEIISLHAGPQIGFLLSAEAESDGDKEDIKDEFKATDIGGAFGMGVDLPMGLGFGARYIIGFSELAEDTDNVGEWKNSAFQLYLCYKIFGKK